MTTTVTSRVTSFVTTTGSFGGGHGLQEAASAKLRTRTVFNRNMDFLIFLLLMNVEKGAAPCAEKRERISAPAR
ncbi:unnamed protein product [marine sediment metagenome]|uniref:Uncharacterized protein n=1 Tax=marine sediment metagenome TaxID=412755 RepID=X0W8R1_9ZZZZ